MTSTHFDTEILISSCDVTVSYSFLTLPLLTSWHEDASTMWKPSSTYGSSFVLNPVFSDTFDMPEVSNVLAELSSVDNVESKSASCLGTALLAL